MKTAETMVDELLARPCIECGTVGGLALGPDRQWLLEHALTAGRRVKMPDRLPGEAFGFVPWWWCHACEMGGAVTRQPEG